MIAVPAPGAGRRGPGLKVNAMRVPVKLGSLSLLCLALGASAASAQYGTPAAGGAVPYTPPIVYAPPRTFQHTQPQQQDQGQEAWVSVPGSRRGNWGGGNWGSGNWGRGRGVEVAVPIPLGPTPPQSQAQLTSQIVGLIEPSQKRSPGMKGNRHDGIRAGEYAATGVSEQLP